MNSPARPLPYGKQFIDDDDIAAVVDALRSDFLTTGPRVADYEQAFAAATGARHAVACNSGTAALHLAALALDLGPGDAAVVPAVTFLATANAVRLTGAEVVFADVDPNTGLLTPETLAAALTTSRRRGLKIRVALPVHLAGQLCDLAGLSELAAANDILLVEDACHALGVPNVGATEHSALACFSTHPVKAIATGEGGMITTANGRLADRMRLLRSHGMTRMPGSFVNADLAFDRGEMASVNPYYYEMHEIGLNYRLPDILCALGISQLQKLERFMRRRREIAELYDRLLAPLAPVLKPVPRRGEEHGWHLYAILVEFGILRTTRADFMRALQSAGIGTQVHYIPLHLQPYYRQRYGSISLPCAESYYARCLSIPMFPAMTNDDVARVADAFRELVKSRA